eukprot:SAG22_NODE_955_length_6331_cov_21.329108_2_plen_135_part_00
MSHPIQRQQSMDREGEQEAEAEAEGEDAPLIPDAAKRRPFPTFRQHEQLVPEWTGGRVKRRVRPMHPLLREKMEQLPTAARGVGSKDVSCAQATKMLCTYLAAMAVAIGLFMLVTWVFFKKSGRKSFQRNGGMG